jgi:hypothetical protein
VRTRRPRSRPPGRPPLLPALTVLLATAFVACADPGPSAPPAPPPSPPVSASTYLRTTDPVALDELGCRQGTAARTGGGPDRVAVLAFGKPRRVDGAIGVSVFGPGFASVADVEAAATAYAQGYARCAAPNGPALVMAVGTSNFGDQVTYEHGRAWAGMVNDVNERLTELGVAPQVEAAGAADLELGWNSPAVTRRWVDGYGSAARWPYYDFGEALACPPAGPCHGRWTQEDVWYVAWGAPFARPLPEIYSENGVMAAQWYRLSLYGYLRHGTRMTIAGVVSQARACTQTSNGCEGLANQPADAWSQLWAALNRDPRTAQPLPWSTDFGWSGR